ncbi:hypothetical protein LXL04_039438 [Taraxacum kok-saghyz]
MVETRTACFEHSNFFKVTAPEARPGQLRPGAYRRQKGRVNRINQVAFLLDTAHHEAASRHMENGHVEKHNTKQGQKPQSLKTMCPYYVPYPRYQAAIH